MKTMHISLSVRGALAQSDKDLRSFVGNLTIDGRPARTVQEVRIILADALAEGMEYIPSDGCDNFDPKKGCLGHIKEVSQ